MAPTDPLFVAAATGAEAHSVAHQNELQLPALGVVAAAGVNCYTNLPVSFKT